MKISKTFKIHYHSVSVNKSLDRSYVCTLRPSIDANRVIFGFIVLSYRIDFGIF